VPVLEHIACRWRDPPPHFFEFARNPLEMRRNYVSIGLPAVAACCQACSRASYLIGYTGWPAAYLLNFSPKSIRSAQALIAVESPKFSSSFPSR
jgi:hypothetical protein